MSQTKPEGVTPSQSVSPYFAYGLTSQGKYEWNDAFSNSLVTADTSGNRIRVEGIVFDGDGVPMPECMLEIWQADAQGRFSDPQDKRAQPNSSFKGFGRIGTDVKGGYSFHTIKPGQVAYPDGKMQAPHLSLAVYARGMLLHLYSRIYFDGKAANAADPVLALVPADRRHTLIAKRLSGPSIASTSTCRAATRRCSSTSEGDLALNVVDSVAVLNCGQVLWQGSSAS